MAKIRYMFMLLVRLRSGEGARIANAAQCRCQNPTSPLSWAVLADVGHVTSDEPLDHFGLPPPDPNQSNPVTTIKSNVSHVSEATSL